MCPRSLDYILTLSLLPVAAIEAEVISAMVDRIVREHHPEGPPEASHREIAKPIESVRGVEDD